MSALTTFLIGVIVGLVLSEFLPPDVKVIQHKVKNKKSGDLNNSQSVSKRGLFRRIFKGKKDE